MQSNTIKLPEKKKVFFQFDNDEPVQLTTMELGEEFTITLKQGNIVFTKDGKSFKLFIQ